MGGLTSIRKRQDESLSLHNSKESQVDSPEFRAYKRPRILYSVQQQKLQEKRQFELKQATSEREATCRSAVVPRILRYPEDIPRLNREVLGPVRPSKFGSVLPVMRRDSGERGGDKGYSMWNSFYSRYNKAKESAFDTLRFTRKEKEKEVINLVEEDEDERVRRKGNELAPVVIDSSIEEIEVAEDDEDTDERGRSAGSGSDCPFKDEDVAFVGNVAQESTVSELTNTNVAGVENAEKMLGSLSLGRDGVEVWTKSAYKKLLEDAERRNAKLGFLGSQIRFSEDKLSSLQELRPAKKSKEKVPQEPFIPLTKEEEAEVSSVFSGNRRKVLVTHENSNIEITGELLQCLGPGAWLNDEVINVYLELLKEREKREPTKLLNCHFFNTFFYKKLTGGNHGYDYKSVRRWTSQRKLGYSLLDCDKIFVPIHREVHWCLAVINKKDQKFQYLDSLGGRDAHVLRVLAKYYVHEVKDKNGKDIDVSSWEQEYVEDLPEQENGFDCGMFMIKYADFYSRGLGLCFNQEHMPYFRLRTAKEILRLRAD